MARTLDAIASQLGDAFVEDRLLALTAGVQPARRVLSAGDQKS
ncbi:MAG TPA: hypothetical protein VFA59_23610 [Vicinamibacterales bacterium]|nr:hypothetical protein [Vicinamibacterales bacterium]